MRQFVTIILIFLIKVSAAQQYQLVWEDNFDSLNTGIWLVQNNFDHYGNELQVYTNRAENVFISDGNLVLRVNREAYSCPPGSLNPWGCARQYNTGQPYQYTSGWVETQPAYNTQFGKIEARINLPWGRGFWPAFWTFVGEGLSSYVNAAEIDIFEMYGHRPSNLLYSNVHLEYCTPSIPDYPACNSIPDYVKVHIIPSYANTFHIYTIEWSPEFIKWKMNGTLLRVMANPGVVDPVRTIINMALLVGEPPTPNTKFPSDIKIDYVKVYAPVIATAVTSNMVSATDFTIYPNPVQNTLRVHVTSNQEIVIYDFEIINILGRRVLESRDLISGEIQLDVTALPTSHYQLRINTNKGHISLPFIKF